MIEERNRSISQEDWVNLPGGDEDQGSQILEVCLVGKPWTEKNFNVRTFMNTICGV